MIPAAASGRENRAAPSSAAFRFAGSPAQRESVSRTFVTDASSCRIQTPPPPPEAALHGGELPFPGLEEEPHFASPALHFPSHAEHELVDRPRPLGPPHRQNGEGGGGGGPC